jgi:hypothetical protein
LSDHPGPVGGSPPGSADHDVRATVDAMLARFRAEILGGRGPGADDDEVARHTRDRPTVGGTSTAVSREVGHVRTARYRGVDPAAIEREVDWARPWAGSGPEQAARAEHHGGVVEQVLGRGAALAILGALAWRLVPRRAQRARRAP